ncbi:UNVERIFIED_CONTAM: hypothetical protein HDU68_012890 [Siphonaria sp. JEL0065]|nr:hypothetical protein HDU68_012890 [Siphonaria sp. JEL0065]
MSPPTSTRSSFSIMDWKAPKPLIIHLHTPIVQVESPIPLHLQASHHAGSFAKGSITINAPQGSLVVAQLDVSVIGTVKVDTHKLALSWIKGGATTMRSANSQAAEKVDRKVYSKTVTVWRSESLDSEDGGDSVGLLDGVIPFMIPISEKCPSSVATDCYSVEYTVKATLFTTTKAIIIDSPATTNSDDMTTTTASDASSMHSSTHRLHPLVSESTPLIVHSVRSRNVLESLLDGVFVHSESMDGFVDVSVKAEKEEVVLVDDSEVERVVESGVEWRYVDLEVTVKGKLDVARVESIDAVWKQNTEFRFTALKEDMENRSIIRENGRIEQPRKVGDHVVVHIPVNTKTLLVSHPQPLTSKPYLHPSSSVSNNHANLRISTCSNDIISMYSFTNDRLQDSSIGTRNDDYQRGIKSAAPLTTSPLRRFSKRKNSLPDVLTPFPLFHGGVGGSEVAGLELMEMPLGVSCCPTATENGGKFKPFSFLKKLVGSGASGSAAAVSADKARNTEVIGKRSRIPYGSSHPGISVAATSTSHAKFMGAPVQQVNQDLKYHKDSSVDGGTKSIAVKIRVPILPKDIASKAALLPGTRLREVTRTHFVVVRVKYHVKKERVQRPLRHDRYVEVVVPLRLVHLRV